MVHELFWQQIAQTSTIKHCHLPVPLQGAWNKDWSSNGSQKGSCVCIILFYYPLTFCFISIYISEIIKFLHLLCWMVFDSLITGNCFMLKGNFFQLCRLLCFPKQRFMKFVILPFFPVQCSLNSFTCVFSCRGWSAPCPSNQSYAARVWTTFSSAAMVKLHQPQPLSLHRHLYLLLLPSLNAPWAMRALRPYLHL